MGWPKALILPVFNEHTLFKLNAKYHSASYLWNTPRMLIFYLYKNHANQLHLVMEMEMTTSLFLNDVMYVKIITSAEGGGDPGIWLN